MYKAFIFAIFLFVSILYSRQGFLTTSFNNIRNLQTCGCTVLANATAYKAYCTKACNSQSACTLYRAYCKWGGSVNITCPQNCSGKGTCNTTTGVCTCTGNYTGLDCSKLKCLNNCTNAQQGLCNTTTGVCACYGNYFGQDCSLLKCPKNCTNSIQGTCNNKTGQCTCNPGYLGIDCSQRQCPNNCSGNGVCDTTNGQCKCNTGFTGLDCSTVVQTCPNACSNKGVCVNGKCQCNPGFIGDDCSIVVQKPDFEHSLYLLVYNAWTADQIKQLFAPACDGYLIKFLHLAYANPSQTEGLSFAGLSPDIDVFYNGQNIKGKVIYKEAITGLFQSSQIRTLITIGGFAFRKNFKFLESLTEQELLEWANKVKTLVDSFGAHGIDIDFEDEDPSQWYPVFVKNNLIHKLRAVFPRPTYTIKISIPFAGALDYNSEEVPALFNPPLNSVYAVGIALPVLQAYWNEFDKVQVMSYSHDPNLDPTQNLNLVKSSLDSYLNISNSQTKLVLGGFIGQHSSTCASQSWCFWGASNAELAAKFVYNNYFSGMFYWTSIDATYDQKKILLQASFSQLFPGNLLIKSQASICQSQPQCVNNCNNNGNCINGQCICNAGYYGNECQSQYLACPKNCSSRGTCNNITGKCTCNTGYFGDDCSQEIVIIDSCPNKCSGKGQCNTLTGKCTCISGYTGNDCSIPEVNPVVGNYEHSMYILTWQAWNPDSIKGLFAPACDGMAQFIYIAFGNPHKDEGISFLYQSPDTTVWYNGQNQPASVVYKEAAQALFLAKGIKTLISVGGWTYRDNFNFLINMTDTQVLAWAQKVKAVVDKFGCHGVEIDFELDTIEEWRNVLVKSNVFGKLRQVMPAGQYVIKLTTPYGGVFNVTKEQAPNLFVPPIGGSWAIGTALEVVKQNWKDIDSFNIMSYANDPNLDPTQCLALSKKSLDYVLGINNSETKLVLGGMVGPNGCPTGWCNWNITHAEIAATWVNQQKFKGMFWWPGEGITYATLSGFYRAAHIKLTGQAPVPLVISGICNYTAPKTCPNNCNNQGTCDTVTGKCICQAGFTGLDCSQKVYSCPNNCTNSNQGTCNTSTGVCSCIAPFSGIDCSSYPVKTCPNNCGGTKGTCNNVTGVCTCYSGWQGIDCSEVKVNNFTKIPNKVIVGYWHNWDLWQASFIPLIDVLKSKYNFVIVTFIETKDDPVTGKGWGYNAYFEPVANRYPNEATFISEVKALKNAGIPVIVSIGGQNGHVELKTEAEKNHYVSCLIKICEKYGFDGIDVDYEGQSMQSMLPSAKSLDLKDQTNPQLVLGIQAIRDVYNHFGTGFIITAAPEIAYVQDGYAMYPNGRGQFLPFIHNIRDILSFLHVQLYNYGTQIWCSLDGIGYKAGTPDTIVAPTEMLMIGFPLGQTGLKFPPLREDQVVIGLMASPSAGGPGFYMKPNLIIQALTYLTKGIKDPNLKYTFKGSKTSFPGLRGMMTWSINWDKSTDGGTASYEFCDNYAAFFGV